MVLRVSGRCHISVIEALRDKYRELANRELSLGRHRRAAYIFAHLLGDMHSAAAALKSGGHWREAAVLYRDRLNRPQLAAECFEQGGLWSEAIDIYLQLESFEKVGDLFRRIGQDEQAEDAFRRTDGQVPGRRRLSRGRASGGEEIERAAGSPALSRAAWPNSDQAIACLNQMFTILAARGQHEDAQKLIDKLTRACSRCTRRRRP